MAVTGERYVCEKLKGRSEKLAKGSQQLSYRVYGLAHELDRKAKGNFRSKDYMLRRRTYALFAQWIRAIAIDRLGGEDKQAKVDGWPATPKQPAAIKSIV